MNFVIKRFNAFAANIHIMISEKTLRIEKTFWKIQTLLTKSWMNTAQKTVKAGYINPATKINV